MLTEKMMEDQIAERPEEFLGEGELVLVSRQLRIGKYIFDLLFEDRFGGKLIVEIQKGTLDRTHTYKILDYYDEYREHHPSEFIELMVVANSVPLERKKRLHSLGVEFREIPESRFLEANLPDRVQVLSEEARQTPMSVERTPSVTSVHNSELQSPSQSLGRSAFIAAARAAIDARIIEGNKLGYWKTGGQNSLTVAYHPLTRWLHENGGSGLTAQIWMERPKNGSGVCKFEIAGDKEKKALRENVAAKVRALLASERLPEEASLATGSTVVRCSLSLPAMRTVELDSAENASRCATEIIKITNFFDFLDAHLLNWSR